MDRNICPTRLRPTVAVALRKESVDRNHVVLVVPSGCWLSLSARRAWIEIRLVDMSAAWNRLSLSARRAWIEIMDDFEPSSTRKVALRKESVDRNFTAMQIVIIVVDVALRKESVDRNTIS